MFSSSPVSDYKGTDCLAHFRHGSRDQEPGIRYHVVDIVRTTIPAGKAVLDIGSFDGWSCWMEHCYVVEEGCV